MAGPAVGDPWWAAPLPTGETYLDWCDRPPGRLRVARFATPVITDVAVDAEVLAGYEAASRLLSELGHDVEEVPVPMARDAVPVFETCWAVGAAVGVPAGREDEVRPLTRWLAERGRAVTAPEYALAVGELRRVAARTLAALAPYDIVLTPTLAQLPAPVGSLRDDEHPERDFENQKAFTPWTSAWNVTGMPAVSLPLHHTSVGLPVGVMLAGRPGEDHRLLALAAQVEQAAPWRDRTPPCW
jgi:amidase